MLSRRSVVAAVLAGVPALGFVRARAQESKQVLIRAVYYRDFRPYSFFDEEEGRMRGILIDLMGVLGEACGYAMTHEGFPWARAQYMVANDLADALCCPITEKRKEYVYFAPTIVTPLAEAHLFVTVDNPRADEIRAVHSKEGLYAFNVVDFIGNSSGEHIWQDHPQRLTVRNIQQILKMLLRGRADFYYADPLVTWIQLAELGVLDKFFSIPADYVTKGHRGAMSFGLRKTYPDAQAVVARVEEAIRTEITPDLHDGIIARYTR
ncbi:substrate-binding periplasmic protein [Pelagibius marinus]|uniref:substrate-binding periplasmic protein n=1 Tax=Pelagibius marinus TaxID=2762760 RepID=UPI001872BDA1|nr:transporter substrate-binding domain-containing protein [Pelagibius marinus]